MAAVIALFPAGLYAQNLQSGYFDDNYLYRFQSNPAFGNEGHGFVAMPGIGNLNVATNGTIGINHILYNVNGQSNIMFDVYNTGKTTLYNVWVKFEGDSISGGDSFLGTISSGATGSVDAMVTGAAATMDDGKIKAVISYENESGVVSTVEKELELFVSEEFMGDFSDPSMGMEGEMGMEELEGGGGIKPFILPIVLVSVVVLIAVIVVIVRIRKKKKEKAELDADLEALDETDK